MPLDAHTVRTRNRSRRQSKVSFARCHLVLPFFKKLTQRLVKRESLSSLSDNFEASPLEYFEDDQEEQEKLILQINNTPKHRFRPISFETQRETSAGRKDSQEDQQTRPGRLITGDNRLGRRMPNLRPKSSLRPEQLKRINLIYANTHEFRKPSRKMNLKIEIPGENALEKENQELHLENLELKRQVQQMKAESKKLENKLFLMRDQVNTLMLMVEEGHKQG